MDDQLIMTHFPHPKSWFVFLVALIAYVSLVLFFPPPPTMSATNGDEPHYLIATHSLYIDHDLAMANNYENQDYKFFYDEARIEPHLYNFKGRLIPYHPMLGMPLTLLLPYAIGGRTGVWLLLNLLVAGGLTWLYGALRAFVPERSALITVLFCGLTYPVVIYSAQIYPDTIGFVLVAFVLYWTIGPSTEGKVVQERVSALIVGVALGLLPHFHFKFALLSLTLYAFFLWQRRTRLASNLRWSLAPILLLALAFVGWIYHIYGEFSRDVFVAPSQGEYGSGRLDGMVGLFFDQEYGLFFFAPIYLLAIVGGWAFWRNPATRAHAFFLTLIYASHHLLSGTFYDWDGGLSPVPRYLLPALPVLILFVGQGLASLWRHRQWLQPLGLALITLWITRLILFDQRPLMFGFEIGSNAILREYYHWPRLINLLPSFKQPDLSGAYLRVGGLILIICGLWLFAYLFHYIMLSLSNKIRKMLD